MSAPESETWKSLAGMCAVICSSSDKKYKIIENILRRNYCVNCPIPEIPYFARKKADLIGNTVLHLALKQREHGTFNFLINQGADFTLKNRDGETVLHQAFRKSNSNFKECDKLRGKLNHPYIDSALSAHVESQKASNPSNKNGLSHFHIACMVNHVKSVEFFLKNGASVSETVNFDSPSLPGYSPLHFAARYCAYETAQLLLDHGADLHAKDARGASPLHMVLERNTEIADWLNTGRRTRLEAFEKEMAANERIVAAFLDHLNDDGRVDEHGFTQLHIACTLRDSAVAEKLVQLGHDIHLAISRDSPVFAGYTPLHFAAHFNIDTVKLLLRRGADVAREDAAGSRPFDVCLRKLDIASDIHVLVGSQPSWKSATFSGDGELQVSLHDFAYAMRKRESLHAFLRGIDINMRLQSDSPLWAGYTPLHLLVLFVVSSNGAWDLYESSDYVDDVSWHDLRMVDAIELCIKLGADVTVQDARGYTPLHLAFYLQKAYLVSVLLRAHKKTCNPVDENGLAHFHIGCASKDTDFVLKLLKSRRVDVNSPITFGFRMCKEKKTFAFAKSSTPLHIAVIMRNLELAKILLARGANYVCKDDDALTPVHRLLGLNRGDDENLARALLSSYNLCFMMDNVAPLTNCGLTYLHVVSYWENDAAVEKLLDLGADPNAKITYKRADGKDSGRARCRSIRSERPIDSLTFLGRYTGYTALQLAMEEKNDTIVRLLVQRGADILARNADDTTPTYDILKSRYSSVDMVKLFVETLKRDAGLQRRMLDDSGMTMLHVACAAIDFDLIKDLCAKGVDVNARTRADSPIWPGCTPLHVLMSKSKDNLDDIAVMIGLLLDCGADVTLTNVDGKTPLHEDFERFFVQGPRFASLLLRAQKDYSVNPVSIKGISHFHIACSIKDVAVVKEFLKHGADINLPVSNFCEFYGGLTPLHLASVHHLKDIFIYFGKRRIDVDHAIHYILQIQEDPFYVAPVEDYKDTVNLLLQHGANPSTEDRTGNTSIHVAVASKVPQKHIWESLIAAGANVNVENLLDETPFEILLCSEKITSQLVEFFLRHGGIINNYSSGDEEGFIPKMFLQHPQQKEDVLQCLYEAMTNLPDINYFDEMGRSLIHNVVSHSAEPFSTQDYMNFIEAFERMGHGIDHRDKRDRTALHVAIEFRNLKAVHGLLASGADINVFKESDKATAVIREELQKNVPVSIENSSLLKNLSGHIYKLKSCGIYVDAIMQEFDARISENFTFNFNEFKRLCAYEVTQSKSARIEPHPLTLYDFLSETGVVAEYPMLPQIQRRAIAEYFRNNDAQLRRRFPNFLGVMKLQHRKALVRVTLVEPAKTALSILMDLEFPDLCSEAVLRFLTNEDLKNLTLSADA